jgi:uncharacterized protein (TIGR02246 family)
MLGPSGVGSDVDAVRRVAADWTRAVAGGQLDELAQLMTDDIVVVHGDGRSIAGRDAVLAEFGASFARYRVNQEVTSEETVVAGQWAFDRARVRTVVSPRDGGDGRQFSSRTLTILHKEPARGWCVARAIGVVER